MITTRSSLKEILNKSLQRFFRMTVLTAAEQQSRYNQLLLSAESSLSMDGVKKKVGGLHGWDESIRHDFKIWWS